MTTVEVADDPARWDAIVKASPTAVFFQTSAWIEAVCRAYGYRRFLMIAGDHGAESGVLPLVEVKSRIFGHRLISLPFCEYGGPVILRGGGDTLEALLTEGRRIRSEVGAKFCEYRAEEAGPLRPSDPEVGTSSTYVTFRVRGVPDEIWGRMDKKLRNRIRRAEEASIQLVRVGEPELAEFYKFYLKTEARRGSPVHSQQFFKELLKAADGAIGITLAKRGGKPVSAILTGTLGQRSNWWLNVNDPEFLSLNATSLMLWDFVKRTAKTREFSLDLGRTRRDTSVYDYKSQWGGEEVSLAHFSDPPGPSAIDPRSPRFRLASAVWRVLPKSAVAWAGPRLMAGIAL